MGTLLRSDTAAVMWPSNDAALRNTIADPLPHDQRRVSADDDAIAANLEQHNRAGSVGIALCYRRENVLVGGRQHLCSDAASPCFDAVDLGTVDSVPILSSTVDQCTKLLSGNPTVGTGYRSREQAVLVEMQGAREAISERFEHIENSPEMIHLRVTDDRHTQLGESATLELFDGSLIVTAPAID